MFIHGNRTDQQSAPRRIDMRMFGKTLSEYIEFQKGILGLILVVGVIRLALSLAGVSVSGVKWFSITGVLLIGTVYYGIRVHTRGFGSYKHLLPLSVIQNLLAHVIAAAAIALAIFTGTDNIYSLPEYSGGSDGKTWTHAGAHLVFGGIAGSLVGWLLSAGVMFVTKKVAPGTRGGRAAVAGA
jgi:hypothetical protein